MLFTNGLVKIAIHSKHLRRARKCVIIVELPSVSSLRREEEGGSSDWAHTHTLLFGMWHYTQA